MFIPDKSKFNSLSGLMVYNRHDVRNKSYKSKDMANWIIGIGQHRGLLKGSLWVKTQSILKHNMNHRRLGSSQHHILSGLIYCDNCSLPLGLRSSKSHNKIYYYYTCPQCRASINASHCDGAIQEYVDTIGMNKRDLKKKVISELSKADVDITTEIAQTIDTAIDSLSPIKNAHLELQKL